LKVRRVPLFTGVLLTSYINKVNIDDDRFDALKALLQVFKAMSDVTARIAVNSGESIFFNSMF
jgi:hypothetical protein